MSIFKLIALVYYFYERLDSKYNNLNNFKYLANFRLRVLINIINIIIFEFILIIIYNLIKLKLNFSITYNK